MATTRIRLPALPRSLHRRYIPKTNAHRSDASDPKCKGSAGCFMPTHKEHAPGNGNGNGNGAPTQGKPESAHRRPESSFPAKQHHGNDWDDMTTEEVRVRTADAIAIMPVSATEQHGPHLPLSVDRLLNEGVLNAALEMANREDANFAKKLLVLPHLPIGKSVEHDSFAGTLSLRTETLAALWTDVAESAYRSGIRKLVIFNSHGGQPQVMEIVARDLRSRLGMTVITLSWFSFGVPENIFPDDELRHGIHAGAIETSMMLALRPDLVRESLLANFKSRGEAMVKEEGFQLLTPEGGVGFGWLTEDLSESGAMGDATIASSEKGELIIEYAASKLVELLREVDRFELFPTPAVVPTNENQHV
ncbi:creatinine amidohydrolase [Pseudoscourfieldia marina]